MTPEEAIEMLRGMQNKKVDYAEMICAPAFAYGYEYVYPEPEDYAIEEAIKALKEIQQYREIGTVEECRGAVEKQKPKKPLLKSKKKKITIGNYIYVTCPSCGETIFSCFLFFPWNETQCSHRYCENCGQAIDWSTDDLEGMKDERD